MHRPFSLLLFSSLLFCSCEKTLLSPEAATPPPPSSSGSRLAGILDSTRYALALPALAGAVVTDTGLTEFAAVGCRRFGGAANVTRDDQFHLGSCTKAFTAMLIGSLIDEGRLSWTTPLDSLFPEYAATMRTEYRGVTIHQVLSHSAGFPRDPSLSLSDSPLMTQRREVVAWAFAQPPAAQRGEYLYSNLGFILAGAVAERITGRPYEELLSERVLIPLGITTAGFGPMGTVGREDQPLQHTVNFAPIEPAAEADNHPIYNPAGRLHMAIGDWAKYVRWVLAAESGTATILRLPTARMLTTGAVQIGGGGMYACGWGVQSDPMAGGKVLTHGGCNGFNYSFVWIAPNRRFAVLCATNIATSAAVEAMCTSIPERLMHYHLNGN